MNDSLGRANREVLHSRQLASKNAEKVWGWQSAAGKIRAQRRAELIISASNINANSRVLEIGCGTGLFTEIFAKTGAEIIAIDISPELLDQASARTYPKGNVQLVCEKVETFTVDPPFDAVVGSSVLHHLEVNVALEAIYCDLKPGGRIAFAEPNMLNPQIMMGRTIFRKILSSVSSDEIAFVRWSFRNQLQNHGFDEVSIISFDWLHPRIPKVLISLVNNLGQIFERIPGIREFAGSLMISGCHPRS